MYLIINSENEYWSNEFGWVGFDMADSFTPDEKEEYNLPIGGTWILKTDCEEFYC